MRRDLAAYAEHLDWLLDQFQRVLTSAPPEALIARAEPGTLETNSPLAIARHATAVVRVYALGFGAGQNVTRDRGSEFSASPGEFEVIRQSLAEVRAELLHASEGISDADLDAPFVPPSDLYGKASRSMTPRGAIVEGIRHTAIHLGELRLTLSQG